MHLFLSPHPDDVPLSCGGTLYHLREARGEQSVILTIMSGDPPTPLPDTPIVCELHQRWAVGENPMVARRVEDEQAAIVLSAKTIIHTSVPDCVYRTSNGEALYPDGESIFGRVHPDDTAPAQLIFTPLPLANEVTHVYAPLGVGNHVDHQIIRDWALRLGRDNPKVEVLFYEDYPYCETEGATQAVLDQFPVELTSAVFPLRQLDVLIKLTALQAYTSQISTFWSSIEAMEARVTGYMTAAGDGSPVERFWRMTRT